MDPGGLCGFELHTGRCSRLCRWRRGCGMHSLLLFLLVVTAVLCGGVDATPHSGPLHVVASRGLAVADRENVDWVEMHLSRLPRDQAGYLHLLFSTDALVDGGTFRQIGGLGGLASLRRLGGSARGPRDLANITYSKICERGECFS